jgi:hypothetical protein
MWIVAATSALAAPPLDALLAHPASVASDPATPAGFRMVALGHLAEAAVGGARDGTLSRADAIAAVDRVAGAALDPPLSPWEAGVGSVDDFGHHGLFLSHLAIVLGARDALHPETCDEALHRRIAEHLAAAAAAHPRGVGRSFASSASRWPADQAATLYALWLHDRAHGTALVDAPRERLLGWLLADGLPPTEITGTSPDWEIPRGSSLSFTARYLAPVAPDAARTLWARMQDGYVVRSPVGAGIREWPPGVERASDIDSGPIVLGVGASATAFGLAAARAIGDEALAQELAATARLGEALARAGVPGVAEAAGSALAVSIAAVGAVQDPLGRAPR